MPLFRVRPAVIEAMHFGGSPASAVEVIAWARSVAPMIMVRERIEYGGWHDPDGHIELEIQGNDVQASNGDWIICNGSAGNRWFEVVSDTVFRQRYEPHPGHIPA